MISCIQNRKKQKKIVPIILFLGGSSLSEQGSWQKAMIPVPSIISSPLDSFTLFWTTDDIVTPQSAHS